jgi:formylglycine-generating enzyme required for sulfatase activity
MESFASSYLAELTASLTAHILEGAGRRLSRALSGTAEQQALRNCVQAGIVALVATMGLEEPTKREHAAEIFRAFFADADTGRELAALLRGSELDREELAYLFDEAGYDADTLPGLDLSQGLAAFEAAFLVAATQETALQGTIQTGQLLIQTHLQRELVAIMRELVAFLSGARPGSVGIQAHRIVAQNVNSGVQVVYQLRPLDLSLQAADWEGHYLRTLISRCEPLDLPTIDPTHPLDAEPVRISDVFTTLYLEDGFRFPEQSVAEALQQGLSMRRDEMKEIVPIQAVEAVASLPRLVILGRPGGGKSTLVNHVAIQLARRRLGQSVDDEKLPGWAVEAKPLPVRIVLRRFAAWLPEGTRRGEAGLVWDYLRDLMQQWGCRGACEGLERTLKNEGGIVFFDGLDEVRQTDAEAKRSLIKEAIAAFAAPLDKCQVVVTCREYAYRQGDAWRLPKSGFPVVELALFDLKQVEAFTRTWYRVVGPGKGWSEQKCEDEAQNLYQAVKAWPHLQELAQYPLLLTLMSQVHGRDGYLPQGRADLYERAVDLLLAHWENRIVRDMEGEQQVLPGLVMQLGIRTATLRGALERAAFEAHERQELEPDRGERAADIPREDLRDALAADLGSVDRADDVIAYVQERAGLLQARDNRTYAFPHRTFQEYLAATYILKQGEFDTLLRDRVRRDPGWWQEVFLLAAGASRGTPRNVSDLVDCLLPMDAEDGSVSPDKAQEAQLAAQALHETGFTEHVDKEAEAGRFSATYDRVRGWLMVSVCSDETLPAQQRAHCGEALARLGDPRPGVGVDAESGLPDVTWCKVPAGPFLMGSSDEDPLAYDDEKRQHEQEIGYDYWLARYPVTQAQYRPFVQATGHEPPTAEIDYENPYEWHAGQPPLHRLNQPVVLVTWHDARAYCAWLTAELRVWRYTPEPLATLLRSGADGGRPWRVRLPTEAEWEKAARGTEARIFPWGDEPDPNCANYGETEIGTTSAVGCFPAGASPYGVLEMSGNAWEWTHSLYESYPYEADDGRETLDDTGLRVLRGGSFTVLGGACAAPTASGSSRATGATLGVFGW